MGRTRNVKTRGWDKPSQMTIQELKDELRKKGVDFPAWCKKKKLVAIFEKISSQNSRKRPPSHKRSRTVSGVTFEQPVVAGQARDLSDDDEQCDMDIGVNDSMVARDGAGATITGDGASGRSGRSRSGASGASSRNVSPSAPLSVQQATASVGVIPEAWNNGGSIQQTTVRPEVQVSSMSGMLDEMRTLLAEQKQLVTGPGKDYAHAHGVLPPNRQQQWPTSMMEEQDQPCTLATAMGMPQQNKPNTNHMQRYTTMPATVPADRGITCSRNGSGNNDVPLPHDHDVDVRLEHYSRPGHNYVAPGNRSMSFPVSGSTDVIDDQYPTNVNLACSIPGLNITRGVSVGYASDSLPRVDIVSPSIRRDIIAGKDVNLAALLIPGYNTDDSSSRHLVRGSEIVPLKPLTDSRLTRTLTLPEFLKAFSVYKNVMTGVYPVRRAELDTYQNDIIDMATRFPAAFYEYHKAFSARAAAMLTNNNIKIDWATRDTTLFCSIFAGQRANTCTVCNSLTHTATFCSQTFQSQGHKTVFNSPQHNSNVDRARPHSDMWGRQRVVYQGKEICNNFNATAGCNKTSCRFCHICSCCKSPNHPGHLCKTVRLNATSERSRKDISTPSK